MFSRICRSFASGSPVHSKVLILGAGDGGTSTARLLKKYGPFDMKDVRIIDPSPTYWYQSFQTLVGAGLISPTIIHFANKWLLPRRVVRTYARVEEIDPENNVVQCDDNNRYSYDILVVALGLEIRVDLVDGLKDALSDENCPVATNYLLKYSNKYSKLRQNFKGGVSLFTQPSSHIKCGGAPQKIMYLSCYDWIQKKIPHEALFYSGTQKYFVNDFYQDALLKVAESYNIKINLNHDLVEIKPKEQIAIFKNLKTYELIEQKFDIMHVTPPQRPPSVIAQSKLAGLEGYLDVDIFTLQHKKYPNVFGIGDCTELPTAKTTSVMNEQSYVLVKNLTSYVNKKPMDERYNGYTGCPVFVGGKKLMLCEFGYNQMVLPTFADDQRKPRYSFYILKRYGIPFIYLVFGPDILRTMRHTVRRLRGKNPKIPN